MYRVTGRIGNVTFESEPIESEQAAVYSGKQLGECGFHCIRVAPDEPVFVEDTNKQVASASGSLLFIGTGVWVLAIEVWLLLIEGLLKASSS